jgi:hydrophobic/amphiphilic exporter-1 (mainly G- bacteria), HAE1 family
MWLTRTSILRPVTIIMMVAAILVLGLTSLKQLPVDLYPKIDFPYITVVAAYAGTGPQEVETLISKPLEDAVSTISRVKNVTSSSQEGISIIGIEFVLGTDLDTAMNDVRAKVDATRMLLPSDMDPPVISKVSTTAIPVISFALSSPRPPKELRHLADDVVKDRLGKLAGVGSVSISGGDLREILVSVDKSALEGYGLTITDVVLALQATNLNLPSGSIKEGPREYAVRAVGEFAAPEDINDVRLVTRRGSSILLSDVARVRDTVAERTNLARMNGKDSVSITVFKQSDANTVQVAEAVRAELHGLTGQTFDELGKEVKSAARTPGVLPADITASLGEDQSVFIGEALHDLQKHLLLGALLAVLVVFLFLHNLRGTLIVAFAIPTSIIATFSPMLFAGFSLNQMTMLGLSLTVGILVDDSIVVIENIYRHLRMGEKPKEAALNGRTEIGLAAITITLVDVVVFVPVAFMGGIVGQFFRQFGLTVAMATLFSLFVSFTLTPMLSSRWFRENEAVPGEEEEGDAPTSEGAAPHRRRGFFAAFDRVYARLRDFYRTVLEWALDHRLVTVVIGFVILLASVAVSLEAQQKLVPLGIIAGLSALALLFGGKGGRLPMFVVGVGCLLAAATVHLPLGVEMFPTVDQGTFTIGIELPAGSSLAATDRVTRKLEAFLLDRKRFPEIDTIMATVGSSGSGAFSSGTSSASNGSIGVSLVDKTERKRSDVDLVAAVQEFGNTIPGAIIKASAYQGMGGGGESAIDVQLSGSDMTELTQAAERVKAVVSRVKGTTNVDTSWRVGKPEVRAEIDRNRAADRGVSTAQIAGALRASLEGDTTAKYRESSNQYDIRVRLDEIDRNRVDQLSNLVVGYNNGPVYLGDVARVSLTTGPTKIDRKNRQRKVSVTADLEKGAASGNVETDIRKGLVGVPLGNVSVFFGGESESRADSFGNAGQALQLSVILIYILMAALFEGYLSPLIIMFALPMAMAGALLATMLAGKTFSIITLVGIIMLMGLVGKNAILLVDYTNTLRARGLERRAALLEAGPVRLRPILMTTLAMIFGMLPIALATARGGEIRAPMAIAVIGGLIMSTLLTLLVIPVLYTVIDTIGVGLTKLMKSILNRV